MFTSHSNKSGSESEIQPNSEHISESSRKEVEARQVHFLIFSTQNIGILQ